MNRVNARIIQVVRNTIILDLCGLFQNRCWLIVGTRYLSLTGESQRPLTPLRRCTALVQVLASPCGRRRRQILLRAISGWGRRWVNTIFGLWRAPRCRSSLSSTRGGRYLSNPIGRLSSNLGGFPVRIYIDRIYTSYRFAAAGVRLSVIR